MAEGFTREVNFEELGAIVGGLLVAVDQLMYMACRPTMEREAARVGGDPDSPAAVRKLAEVAVQLVNSYLVGGPAEDFANATAAQRISRVGGEGSTPRDDAPTPTLKIVP
jgi:hypothetical protein